jgi:hypothetical protein
MTTDARLREPYRLRRRAGIRRSRPRPTSPIESRTDLYRTPVNSTASVRIRARGQPFAKPAQDFSGLRALRLLRTGHQRGRSLEVRGRDSPSGRFAQPPGFRRQNHQTPEVRPASRANSGASKASLAHWTAPCLVQFGRPSTKKSSSRSARAASASAAASADSIAVPIFS